jgi:hypothetical protein
MAGFLILCVCLFLDWFPLAVLGLICFDYPNGLIYSALLMIAAGIFAISPVNEKIGRAVLGCRPATTEEHRGKICQRQAVCQRRETPECLCCRQEYDMCDQRALKPHRALPGSRYGRGSGA